MTLVRLALRIDQVVTKSKISVRPKNTVFVLGFPRSGTTWISNLINAHPDVIYRHELFGRFHARFGSRLFSSLKHDNGLNEQDFEDALRLAVSAIPGTDRPPFFRKSYTRLSLPQLRKALWLLGRSSSSLANVYSYLYTPRSIGSASLVIKETRSSVNLESMLNGMRADKILVLIRHPYSVVASHIAGMNAGVMSGHDQERRAEWYAHRKEAPYLQERGIGETEISEMTEVEFLAVNWLLQNRDYLEIADRGQDTIVLAYENFLKDPSNQTVRLMQFLGLEVTEQVKDFVVDSTGDKDVSVLTKDASNSFYSVYRDKSFDPQKWRNVLDEEAISLIDSHCELFLQNLALFDKEDFAT